MRSASSVLFYSAVEETIDVLKRSGSDTQPDSRRVRFAAQKCLLGFNKLTFDGLFERRLFRRIRCHPIGFEEAVLVLILSITSTQSC